ncbi:coq1 putative hexaprenyl diphosphate synthase [Marasmius crinis-equi]|uniref:Coq1 putative hexaprenyl diphosphate synthase n=1 Tax=Marasmius crinis-equi TaxID=585013 RepID=A0ABR3FZ22_9AGAR
MSKPTAAVLSKSLRKMFFVQAQDRPYSVAAAQVQTQNSPRIPRHHTPPTRPKLQQLQASPLPPKPPPDMIHRTTDTRNPIDTLQPQLQQIRSNLFTLLGTAHPSLNDLLHSTNYFSLTNQKKMLRVLVVLLWAKAVNGRSVEWETKFGESRTEGGEALTCSGVLNDMNPNTPDHKESFEGIFQLPTPRPRFQSDLEGRKADTELDGGILPTQLRLAQIIEMIHTAGGLHDMVASTTTPPTDSDASLYNKLSILGGDFLLGRASHALSRLGEPEVIELIASVISNRVEGQMWGMEDLTSSPAAFSSPESAWSLYMRKIYLSTACLFAKGARASVVLAGCKEGTTDALWREAAYIFGRSFGIASELSEDLSRFGSPATSPPPLLAAPLLFAWETYPDVVGPLIQRGFSGEGDVGEIHNLINTSHALDRTRQLIHSYTNQARKVLEHLPDGGEGRRGLEVLVDNISERVG